MILRRWLPLLAWMGLIFYLSAQPDLPHPPSGWLSLAFSVGGHLVVYGVLAVLWMRVLGDRPRSYWLAFLLTMLYALSDEFHQAFVPGRSPDLWDLVSDAVGATAGLLAWAWVRRPRGGTGSQGEGAPESR
jgi:VanZ family protein